MRAAAHVLATLVLVPYLVLALGLVLLGRAIATGSLGGIFLTLLDQAQWLIPWGILAIIAGLIAVAVAGVFARTRRLAGACIAALGMSCMAVLMTIGSGSMNLDQLVLLVPCIAATAYGAWVAAMDGVPSAVPVEEKATT